MFNTPNIVGLIKAAAGASDNNSLEWPVYQAPPGGAPHERIFNYMQARAAVPRGSEDIGSALTLGGAMPTFKSNVDTSVQGSIPSQEQHRANQQAAGLDEKGMPLQLDPPEAIAESNELLRQIQADNAAPAASPAPAPMSPQNAKATAAAGNAMRRGGLAPRTSAPASTRPARSSRPATSATPNTHAFRKITADDMRKFRRHTGASNMNSEMDKWKTWQAMQGNLNTSNADFYKARANGFR